MTQPAPSRDDGATMACPVMREGVPAVGPSPVLHRRLSQGCLPPAPPAARRSAHPGQALSPGRDGLCVPAVRHPLPGRAALWRLRRLLPPDRHRGLVHALRRACRLGRPRRLGGDAPGLIDGDPAVRPPGILLSVGPGGLLSAQQEFLLTVDSSRRRKIAASAVTPRGIRHSLPLVPERPLEGETTALPGASLPLGRGSHFYPRTARCPWPAEDVADARNGRVT